VLFFRSSFPKKNDFFAMCGTQAGLCTNLSAVFTFLSRFLRHGFMGTRINGKVSRRRRSAASRPVDRQLSAVFVDPGSNDGPAKAGRRNRQSNSIGLLSWRLFY
jgi:hypothetical protein